LFAALSGGVYILNELKVVIGSTVSVSNKGSKREETGLKYFSKGIEEREKNIMMDFRVNIQ